MEFLPKPTLATGVYVARMNLGRLPGAIVSQSTTYDKYGPEMVRRRLWRCHDSPCTERRLHTWVSCLPLCDVRAMCACICDVRCHLALLWAQLVSGDVCGMGETHCNHTVREWNPYWEVDLGTMSVISEVKVWNREDSPADKAYPKDFFSGRLFPFWIFLSQVPFPAGAGKPGYETPCAAII